MSILDFLGKEILYFDGAMGTRLQAAGLKPRDPCQLRKGRSQHFKIQYFWRQCLKDERLRVFRRGRGAGGF